ncbi:hypothetical protein TKK_0005815 [Trichogramma kaykai]|uniref:Uncharacterized protein n=1 Tax=Trichogramma kaykai TaxID=54128 RepID=A0ABD2XHF4_9HYME
MEVVMETENAEEFTENSNEETSETSITEESLMSMEKLDRASPDLWPEECINKFIAHHLPEPDCPSFNTSLDEEDMNKVCRLSQLSKEEIVLEAKKLLDETFSLGVEESKEMTRGKFLNIFKHL